MRIIDVARAAGVSAATVSNAMNHPALVSDATRVAVQEAIDRLGYAPAPAARQLRTGRSDTVGVVVPNLSNAFWADVAGGAEDAADEQGIRLVISTTRGVDGERERQAIEHHAELGVDGMLVASFQPRSVVLPYLDLGVPIVLVGRQGEQLGISSVSIDETAGMAQAVDHVVGLGHRRIVFANGPTTMSWCIERRAGWRRAMRRHGFDGAAGCAEITVREVMSGAGASLLEQVAELRLAPTAIVCANDVIAVDVVRELRRSGMRVPDDVSVVGYDDSVLAGVVAPALTTVRQDAVRLGVEAIDLLRRLVETGTVDHRLLAPTMVVRESSGPPPQSRPSGRPATVSAGRAAPADAPTSTSGSTSTVGGGDAARGTLQDVLDASFGLIDEGGADALTYRAIAHRAGISLGTLSYHLRPFGDLRDHLWQEVEVRLAASTLGASSVAMAAAQMLAWTDRHRRQALFYATHTPNPDRTLRMDLLSRIPNIPTDPDVLDRHRPFLGYVARRLQTVIEYALFEPDREAAEQLLGTELREQAAVWRAFATRLAVPDSRTRID